MLVSLLAGVFGLIIGSFLNVVVMRRGTGRSILGKRGEESSCLTCGARIHWCDNIPVISWLLLRGRCRSCGARISLHYPLVESLTGLGFFLVVYSGITLPAAVLGCALVATLVAIAAYDIRHTIIPDPWVYAFAGLAGAFSLIAPTSQRFEEPILWLASGPIAALPLFALFFVSRGRWMGFGDVKLAFGIGWLLGPLWGPYAIFLAFVLGAALSIVVLMPLPYIRATLFRWGIVRSGMAASYTIIGMASYRLRSLGSAIARAIPLPSARLTMKSEVPFGPFLIASTFLVWFAHLYGIQIPLLWNLI